MTDNLFQHSTQKLQQRMYVKVKNSSLSLILPNKNFHFKCPNYTLYPFTYDLAWSFSSTSENLWKNSKKKKKVFCQDVSILVYQVERKDVTRKQT